MRLIYLHIYIIISILKNLGAHSNGENRDWQSCGDKCLFLSAGKSTNADLASFCHSKRGSKPADFGLESKETISTRLSLCTFENLEQTPYWINQRNGVYGSCRTITFLRDNVQVDEQVSCRSLMHPICETNKPLCHLPENNTLIINEWVNIDESFYVISEDNYTYCQAKHSCENTWYGHMTTAGTYKYMGLLAKKLGIWGSMSLDFWLDSPGITCPNDNGMGVAMVYNGPLVQMDKPRNAQIHTRMLCKRNSSTLQTRINTISTLSMTQQSTAQRQISSQTTYAPLRQSPSQSAYVTRELSSQITKMQQSLSQSISQRQSLSQTTLQWQSTSKTSATPESSLQATPQRQSPSQILAVSKASREPVWLKVGKKQYYVNYKCTHIQMSFINHFRIFPHPNPKTDSFWIGANITPDEELDETDLELIPYVNKPVRFQTKKEEVQAMWKRLRQQRNPA